MKKLLSLLIASFMLFGLVAVSAEEPTDPVTVETGVGIGIGIEPENYCPEILQENCDDGWYGHAASVCYHVNTFFDDTYCELEECECDFCGFENCVDIIKDAALTAGWVGRSYAFEGERISFQVKVHDMDGIVDDCVKVYVTLDNGYDPVEAGCHLIETNADPHGGFPAGTIGRFFCQYTVEPAESGTIGEYWISVKAVDGCGEGCEDFAAGVISLYLNPAVGLTIEAQDEFGFLYDVNGDVLEEGPYAGDTVYTPYFKVENTADPESGLYIFLQLYGTDMWDYESSDAMCPLSNILNILNVQYNARHLNVQQQWTTMFRSAANKYYVFNNGIPGPNAGEPLNFAGNFLGVGDDVTMRLRLNIPSPCRGVFDDGGEIVFSGQVI
jgi:hypothetical protein